MAYFDYANCKNVSLIPASLYSSQSSLTSDKNNYHRPTQNNHIKMLLLCSIPKEAITKSLGIKEN